MKSTFLYQISSFSLLSGNKKKEYQELEPAKLPCYKEGFVISDFFIMRFHCSTNLRFALSRNYSRNSILQDSKMPDATNYFLVQVK